MEWGEFDTRLLGWGLVRSPVGVKVVGKEVVGSLGHLLLLGRCHPEGASWVCLLGCVVWGRCSAARCWRG